jgi:hypothetical protein
MQGFLLALQVRSDIPWQQFADAIDRLVSDVHEHVTQIAFGIQPVEVGGSCRVPDYAERQTGAQSDLLEIADPLVGGCGAVLGIVGSPYSASRN